MRPLLPRFSSNRPIRASQDTLRATDYEERHLLALYQTLPQCRRGSATRDCGEKVPAQAPKTWSPEMARSIFGWPGNKGSSLADALSSIRQNIVFAMCHLHKGGRAAGHPSSNPPALYLQKCCPESLRLTKSSDSSLHASLISTDQAQLR
jgi:hypothetical protein